MERRSADDARARIDAYLASRLNARGAKVVPLSGDASDRRYFRILVRDDEAQVLAVHPGPIDFEALPFVNVIRKQRVCAIRLSSNKAQARLPL